MGPGTKLGRYELLAAIARGGMAIVWAARPSGPLDKLVAVKTNLPELAGDPSFQRIMWGARTGNVVRATQWVDAFRRRHGKQCQRLRILRGGNGGQQVAEQVVRRLAQRHDAGRWFVLVVGVGHRITRHHAATGVGGKRRWPPARYSRICSTISQ